jgi:hypothetical protein
MVEVFKSPINARALAALEKVHELVMMDSPISIEGHASAHITIRFKQPFHDVPFVSYSLICEDLLCGLDHYIHSITPEQFVVCVENQTGSMREIKIMHEAKHQ